MTVDPAIAFAEKIRSVIPPEVIAAYLASDYTIYQQDPVGFGENVLGETYTDDVKRMMESVRDNVITVAKSANATGKSHGAARVAAWFYLCFPQSQVWTAAAPPKDNLERILWGELGNILHEHPKLFDGQDVKNLSIQRADKEYIAGQPIPSSGTAHERKAKFSGKHAPYLLFIIDEGDAVPDEVYDGIESCMSGGTMVRLLVMFNPRAAMGAPYRMERDGLANVVHLSAFNHPNVVTGENVIPGAVDRGTTVRRINQWCRPLQPGENPSPESKFLLPSYLEGAVGRSQSGNEYPPLVDGHYVIANPAFAHMVLGRFPAQGDNQLISREWIAMARDRWKEYEQRYGETHPDNIQPIIGGDIADKGMDSNVAAIRYGGYLAKLETWPGVDLIDTGERFSKLYHKVVAKKAYIDATGVGAGVAPHMRRLKCTEAYGVMVAAKPTIKSEMGEFTQMRDQLWWSCREWLRTDPYAALPPDEQLIEELSVPTYDIVKGKIKIMAKDDMKDYIQRSPDRADALCMTFATGMVDTPSYTGSARNVEKARYYYG